MSATSATPPKGIEFRDAREICPDPALTERYLVEGKRSLATFSDRFRYEMMLRVDHLLGRCRYRLLAARRRLRSRAGLGPAAGGARQGADQQRRACDCRTTIRCLQTMLARARAAEGADIGWGAIGPFLLTEAAEAAGRLRDGRRRRERFYPIAPDEFWRLIDPASRDLRRRRRERGGVRASVERTAAARRLRFRRRAAARRLFARKVRRDSATLPRFRRVCEVAEVAAIVARWNASAPAA